MRVLIVEDNQRVSQFLEKGLSDAGHTVDCTFNGTDGMHLAMHGNHDAIILDRMLPGDIDGLSIVAAMRASGSKVPILILSALAQVDDRICGLRSGGDDYLVKPFALGELLARLDALVRRTHSAPATVTTLEVGSLCMNLMERRVTRAGKVIQLQPREFTLLEYLMRHAEQIVTRNMLLEAVWGYTFDTRTNIVDVNVSKLRQKIDDGCRPMLRTIRNAGYMLAANE